jgi:hypothetical protein
MQSRTNRIVGRVALVLSLVALAAILVGILTYTPPPPTDEGTLAHIFQIAVGLLAPTILVFLMTVDWSRPLRGVLPLAVPFVAVLLAFSLLYYMEHRG